MKFALAANAAHGHRRTNADKRRCVEIALREFPTLSSRAIAEMCGVGDDLVFSAKRQVPENGTSTVTGTDGKQYPAKPSVSPPAVSASSADDAHIVVVDRIPMPDDPILLQGALQTGRLGPNTAGLTLDHAVFIRRGPEHELRLLRHELLHVDQCEAAGNIASFLAEYLRQLVALG